MLADSFESVASEFAPAKLAALNRKARRDNALLKPASGSGVASIFPTCRRLTPTYWGLLKQPDKHKPASSIAIATVDAIRMALSQTIAGFALSIPAPRPLRKFIGDFDFES